MVKTIGILGGMGALATSLLFNDIIVNTKVNKDQDHIPILVDNNPKIADRTNYILGKSMEDPRRELIKSAKRLEQMGASFLIMPCNTAHFFYDDIIKEINIPFIHMIDETMKVVKNKGYKKVGLLATEGTLAAKVYDKVAEKYDIEVLSPDESKQKYVTEVIYNIKEDKKQESLEGFNETILELKKRGADTLIAGCTEISVAIDKFGLDGILDPMLILAEESIIRAGGSVKKVV